MKIVFHANSSGENVSEGDAQNKMKNRTAPDVPPE